MGGRRVGVAAVVLVLAIPLFPLAVASAVAVEAPPSVVSPFAGTSGVVTAGVAPARTAVADANLTLWPAPMQYRVTNNGSSQNEVSIAVNPRDARNLVVSANDYRSGRLWCGVYATRNGGRTWTEHLLQAEGGLNQSDISGDASVAFDADGDAYISCDGVSAIVVSKSTDGGLTWTLPAQVVGPVPYVLHDKPYIAVDRSSGPTRGNVYVTWTRFNYSNIDCGNGNYDTPIYFSRSTDGGKTWSTERDIAGAAYRCNQGSMPAVGPAGELYVSWVNYWSGGSRIVVLKSADGGMTFGPLSVVSPMVDPGPLYSGRPRTKHLPSLAVNPIDAPGGNRVHVVWADARYGNADILISTSEDGGQTWSAPARLNEPDANAQFFPWVAASDNGKVFVAFYDRRDDPNDRLLTVYLATSIDFGRTFLSNQRVSAQFDPGAWFIGDYIGLAASGDAAYPAWCDLRNGGEEEVYMAGPAILGTDGPPMMNP